jgi:glycerophosphoryl diester phosphodiesterase
MHTKSFLLASALAIDAAVAVPWKWPHHGKPYQKPCAPISKIQLGPRPYFLVDNMDEGPLKDKLQSCSNMEMKTSAFGIGHRGGGTLFIPEETKESMLAGPRMGAGVVECDVTFTKDRKLVCRHDQCDLHFTTNIVTIPELNAKCTQPFTPAANGKPASAKCCTSDITQDEFKSLCGKMEGFNASATTAEDFLHGTPPWRTDEYATCGTVMTHKDYIELVDYLGLQFSPEVKTPVVKMPFQGDYTQEDLLKQFVSEYREAKIDFKRIWAQSFLYTDILWFLKNEPELGKQAVLLDEQGDTPDTFPGAVANLTKYAKDGVKIVAPPLYYLVEPGADGKSIVPSSYAKRAKELGLKIITWTLERSGPLATVAARKEYYYTSIYNVTNNDGDVYNLVDVLARKVGVIAMFSDWSATVTYYANCFGIPDPK